MSDPRMPYYIELYSKSAQTIHNRLLKYAIENNLSYYQLEAYVYNNDMHKEAAFLSIPRYRNALRAAVHKRLNSVDEIWNDAHGIDAVFAIVDYKKRHEIKEKEPSIL